MASGIASSNLDRHDSVEQFYLPRKLTIDATVPFSTSSAPTIAIPRCRCVGLHHDALLISLRFLVFDRITGASSRPPRVQ